jgi:hypothetical protein
MTYVDGNPWPSLEQAQYLGGVKPVNMIPTLLLLHKQTIKTNMQRFASTKTNQQNMNIK